MLSIVMLSVIELWCHFNIFKGRLFQDFYGNKLVFCLVRKTVFADLADTDRQALIRRYFA